MEAVVSLDNRIGGWAKTRLFFAFCVFFQRSISAQAPLLKMSSACQEININSVFAKLDLIS